MALRLALVAAAMVTVACGGRTTTDGVDLRAAPEWSNYSYTALPTTFDSFSGMCTSYDALGHHAECHLLVGLSDCAACQLLASPEAAPALASRAKAVEQQSPNAPNTPSICWCDVPALHDPAVPCNGSDPTSEFDPDGWCWYTDFPWCPYPLLLGYGQFLGADRLQTDRSLHGMATAALCFEP